MPDAGALVISLDFELHWGVRDHSAPDGPYRGNLLGARKAIPEMLRLFAAYDVAATWATVGFLFARSREERERHAPAIRPRWEDRRLDAYLEPVGEDEADDPIHYAASLVEQIRATPRQEIGTHTFSHYYCLEPGHDRESFQADLRAAVAIASARGIDTRSIVFPRNQHNPAFDDLLRNAGLTCYRGNPRTWAWTASHGAGDGPARRATRLADTYVNVAGGHTYPWSSLRQAGGLVDVPASFFIRPWSRRLAPLEPLRQRRVAAGIRRAAERRELVHLWWHPHNFGADTPHNLDFLRRLLDVGAEMRERHGLLSLTMAEVADRAPA